MMAENQEATVVFDQKRASDYDNQWAKLAPTRDALHLLIRIILSELPDDARILCVGVGTGSELIDLAQAFPLWQFTAVEPAAPMLAICRQRVEAYGITSRCTFHEGYLDTLPAASQAFDAATCLVVSHFITDKKARRSFFKEIADRLCPQGFLISSDLSGDFAALSGQKLLAVWRQMLQFIGIPAEEVEKMLATFGREVAVLPPQEVASIIADSGFNTPVLFFQSLLIHAWYARQNTSTETLAAKV